MKLETIQNVINLQQHLINVAGSKNTKLANAFFSKNNKAYSDVIKQVSELSESKKLEQALTDSTGAVLMEASGGYKFNKEGLKKLKEYSDQLGAQDFEISFYKLPASLLTAAEKEILFNTDGTLNDNFSDESKELISYFIDLQM